MPARIEQPRTFHADPCGPCLELFQVAHGFVHVFFNAEDSYQVLHGFLQVAMNGVRIFALTAVEWGQHIALSLGDLLVVNGSSRSFVGISGSAQTGSPTEDE